LNTNSLIKPSSEDTWFKVDFVIDWDVQKITVYVDGDEPIAKESFFRKDKSKI